METNNQLNKFKEVYCDTLKKDPNTGNTYVKIPIEDYEQLGLFRHYILYTIKQLGLTHGMNDKLGHDFGFALEYLTLILDSIDMMNECDGIAKLLNGELKPIGKNQSMPQHTHNGSSKRAIKEKGYNEAVTILKDYLNPYAYPLLSGDTRDLNFIKKLRAVREKYYYASIK